MSPQNKQIENQNSGLLLYTLKKKRIIVMLVI